MDGVAVVGPGLGRTSDPDLVERAGSQVRRFFAAGCVSGVHVTFSPAEHPDVFLALVRLANESDDFVRVDYTETWDVGGGGTYAAHPGAAERRGGGVSDFALGDASVGVRALAPPQTSGLALDVRFAIPPGERRDLAFVRVVARPGEPLGAAVRAWRGEVGAWLNRCGSG